MELSADIMRAYSATSSGSKGSGDSSFDLSVAVLSQGNWPSYPPFPISLPASLTSALDRFKAFYVSKHGGRTLTWAHGLDTCSLRANFPSKGKGGGRKELLVSLAQAVILLLFNGVGEGKMSVEEIGEATKLGARASPPSLMRLCLLPKLRTALTASLVRMDVWGDVLLTEKKELDRTLQSLACGKVRVLVKHPKGKDINAGDQFSFNSVRGPSVHYTLRSCKQALTRLSLRHCAGLSRRPCSDQDQPDPAERDGASVGNRPRLALLCQALSPLRASVWRCLLTSKCRRAYPDAQVEENKSTTDRVFTDRSSHLQLAIVR